MSTKNSNDTIGNRTRDLPTCSAVPQPTALPPAPCKYGIFYEIMQFVQSAYNMCKSLASRGLAEQTMRFILGLGYTTVN